MTTTLTPLAQKALMTLSASLRGQKGGLAKTSKKGKSSAANGKLGGRPRKSAA